MRGGNCLTTVVAVALCTALSGCNTGFIQRDEPTVAQAPIEAREVATARTHSTAAPRRAAPQQRMEAAPMAPVGDAWSRVRARFRFTDIDNALIARERQWYRDHPRYLRDVTARARPYLHLIAEEIEQRDLPGELALLPVLESGYRTDVVSPYGAAGLWQFMGGTGNKFGLEIDRWYDGRLDAVRSTAAALNYLDALHQRFDGDWLLAIAAYNAGWGNLEKAIATQRRLGRPTDLWSLPVTVETRKLAARLVALADIVERPAHYGVTIDPLPDRPYFETVTLREPTDLRRFAAALGAPADEFKQLNAAWRAGHTGSAGAEIYVPTALLDDARRLAERGAARAAPTQLAANTPTTPRANGTRTHRVRNGDSLWAIAARHDVSVAELAAANGLPTRATLRLGQALRIPAGNAPSAAPLGRDTRALAQNRTLRYKVRSGDSLWTISRQFKVTVEQLVAWNGLGRKHQLRPGQELQIRRQS